ncbi:MAG TPA: IS110 family transposase [Parachlamydiaceae bacterium]|nr:IS110 family transposase [Parachlamydiaceae bacterium]
MKKNTKKTHRSQSQKKSKGFEPIIDNVAGIDIGSSLIHVAIINPNSEYEVREFGTTTPELFLIAKWLIESKVETAAMEATGVYWIPLFEILEDYKIKAVLVDPRQAKNAPGRKTDVLDSQWIHKLYSCGLLTPAFRPPKNRENFRAFMRQRANLIKARQRSILQLNKALLLMNIKLDITLSEIASVSGISIIRGIVGGERDPKKLAALRHYSCKKSESLFIEALTGNFQKTHLFSLKQSLQTYDYFRELIDECDKMILEELKSWPTVVEGEVPLPPTKKKKVKYTSAKKPDQNKFNFDIDTLLYQKTGVNLTAINSLGSLTIARVISEMGGKEGFEAFQTEKQWTSWLTLCPGNNVSGGKSLGGQSRKGKNPIKRALCVAAMSLCNAKCALGAYYRRLASRISKAKALKAVAHKLAKLIYNLVRNGSEYVEVGQEEYERRHKDKRIQNLQRNAKELGFELTLAA